MTLDEIKEDIDSVRDYTSTGASPKPNVEKLDLLLKVKMIEAIREGIAAINSLELKQIADRLGDIETSLDNMGVKL